jgi:hypothetical protein
LVKSPCSKKSPIVFPKPCLVFMVRSPICSEDPLKNHPKTARSGAPNAGHCLIDFATGFIRIEWDIPWSCFALDGNSLASETKMDELKWLGSKGLTNLMGKGEDHGKMVGISWYDRNIMGL